MVQISKTDSVEPAKSSVRGKPWKKSAKKGGAAASKPVVVEEEEEGVEVVVESAVEVKDISKVKRKRSKDAKVRRRELAKTKVKDKKKADAATKVV